MRKLIQSFAFLAILSARLPVFAADIPDPIVVGKKITFFGESDGTAPILLEWYRNDVKIGEGSSISVDLTGPELAGTYYARASNEYSRALGLEPVVSTDRYVITVGIPAGAPRINRVLANITVKRGDDVRLEIEVQGAQPMQYSWLHGNTVMRGATQSFIMLPAVKNKDAGFYAVTARNQYGGATSDMVMTVKN